MGDPTGRISHLPDMHRGVSWKQPCRVATTASVTIASDLNAGDTIDGVTLAAGDRVLVKDQGTASQNGIYVAGATPARAFDMDQDGTTAVVAEEVAGAYVHVLAGTANAGTLWRTTNAAGATLGTTSIVWEEVASGAGLTIEEVDASPTVSATKLVFPNGTLGVVGTVATYTPAGGSGDVATDALWDAKGDLAVGTGANTAAKLTAGTNGYVLTADSAESTGLKWAAAGSGSTKYPWDTNYFAETRPGSANATYDDEFDDSTDMSGSVNGLDARWNWRNQGTATTTFTYAGWLTLNSPANSSASYRIIEIAALADGTYDTKVSLEGLGTSGDAGAALVVVDGTNGDFYSFVLADVSGGASSGLYVQRWTNATTFGASVASLTGWRRNSLYMRFVKSSTTFSWWYSTDGIGFLRLATATDAVSATRIGLAVYETKNSGVTKAHFDYFRKVA